MTTDTDERMMDRLLAEPLDPELGVHELTEYTFCARAGRNITGLKQTDTGSDDHVSPLDFPRGQSYEVREIDRQLKLFAVRFILWSIGCSALIFASTKMTPGRTSPAWMITTLFVLLCFGMLLQDGRQLWNWWKQRLGCSFGSNVLPNPEDPNVEILNWWQMYRGGFESVPDRVLIDDKLQLSGKPFKLLRKGSVYIPVFCRDSANPELYPQHFVRIAAYCLLLERLTGMESPYGLVLDRGTFHCLAIKYNRESRNLLAQRLLEARRVIRIHDQTGKPPAPPGQALCSNCRYGMPIQARTDDSLELMEQTQLEQHSEIGNDGQRYHSHCGDRFRWTPPHTRAIQLKLPGARAQGRVPNR